MYALNFFILWIKDSLQSRHQVLPFSCDMPQKDKQNLSITQFSLEHNAKLELYHDLYIGTMPMNLRCVHF